MIAYNIDNRANENRTDRIAKFKDNKQNICRFPQRLLVDLGLVNFPVKIDPKLIYTLETNRNKPC